MANGGPQKSLAFYCTVNWIVNVLLYSLLLLHASNRNININISSLSPRSRKFPPSSADAVGRGRYILLYPGLRFRLKYKSLHIDNHLCFSHDSRLVIGSTALPPAAVNLPTPRTIHQPPGSRIAFRCMTMLLGAYISRNYCVFSANRIPTPT
ncbi:hypothetical protein F4818DRAFT_215405 [Hypoxylon cercidicola]|nr:hypothetical protein F4818DRAFT_215405 [Hypoxylon cercidicola]